MFYYFRRILRKVYISVECILCTDNIYVLKFCEMRFIMLTGAALNMI